MPFTPEYRQNLRKRPIVRSKGEVAYKKPNKGCATIPRVAQEVLIGAMMGVFGDAIGEIVLYEDWPDIGRNEPCPCGCGNKFKKCPRRRRSCAK